MTDVAAKHMKFTRRGVKGDAPPPSPTGKFGMYTPPKIITGAMLG